MTKQTNGEPLKKKYRLLKDFQTTAKLHKKGSWIALTEIGAKILKSKNLIK